MSAKGIMRTTLWTQLHEAMLIDYGLAADRECGEKTQKVIDEVVDLILKVTMERDALQAKIDGGVRVTCRKDMLKSAYFYCPPSFGNTNATLLLDDGVEI